MCRVTTLSYSACCSLFGEAMNSIDPAVSKGVSFLTLQITFDKKNELILMDNNYYFKESEVLLSNFRFLLLSPVLSYFCLSFTALGTMTLYDIVYFRR